MMLYNLRKVPLASAMLNKISGKEGIGCPLSLIGAKLKQSAAAAPSQQPAATANRKFMAGKGMVASTYLRPPRSVNGALRR